MNITHILADLRQRNITVRMKGDDLSVVADKKVLSPEVRDMLVSHKAAIVSYLRQLEQSEAHDIQVVDRRQHLPLSSGQQRLWFLAQLEPDSAAYVIPAAVRIDGPLQPALLGQALDQIIHRHEILRTVFQTEDGRPRQVILSEMAVPFSFSDLRHQSPGGQEAELEEWTQRVMGKAFNLSTGPLLRAALLQLSDREHVLLLALHHIVADGWSMEILVRELSAFYAAAHEGRAANLPALPVQYADYAAWQRRWDESSARTRRLAYWERQLAGLVPLALPTDHPRKDHRSPAGATARFTIDSTLADQLRNLGRQEEATLFMVLIAAFKVLLGRYSGQDQIAVGTPVANRERRETQGLIGFFVNTLVLFTETNGSRSFLDFLRHVRQTTLDALDNQELPFEQLVDHLQPARNLNENPLFQVMFVLQNRPRVELQTRELTLKPLNVETRTAQFDLTMAFAEDETRLQGSLNYNRELFEPATVERMIEHYQALLGQIVRPAAQPIAEIPLLSESERQQLLINWNQTRERFPDAAGIHSLFEDQAVRTPGAGAIEYEGRQCTYAQLNNRANQLAHYLIRHGIGPERLVGICMERSPELLVGLMGILKAGGAYLPLDPASPVDRLIYMVADARAEAVLIHPKLREQFRNYRGLVIELDENSQVISQESTTQPVFEGVAENLAYVIYTSGSTGKPKGVAVEHRQVCNQLLWTGEALGLRPEDRVLQKTSFSFDASIVEIFVPLVRGAKVVIARPGGEQDVDYLVRLIMQQQITYVDVVPALLEQLLEHPLISECTSLRVVCSGGDVLRPELVKRFYQRARGVLWNAYGPTEATVQSTVAVCAEGEQSVSIGKPIANTQAYVLDQYLEPVPTGVVGELYIGGSGVSRGYLHQQAFTAERFVPDPFTERMGGRLYRTGDLARWRASGEIEYLGRADLQVKIRGFRIELGEIETVLEEHPAVEHAVVALRDDGVRGKRLIGWVVGKDKTGELNLRELRNYLRERLPEYQVPSELVPLERLPLTDGGKINRKALPQPEYKQEEEQVARSAEEEMLCGIFADVLKLERIGVTQNFFESGGHSLLATQVISRVRAAFEVDLPVRALFESPTAVELAERIQRVRGLARFSAPPLLTAPRNQAIPLSFAQQRLWFIDQFTPNSSTYNSSVALRLQGNLKTDAMQQAFNEIVRRHEALRTHMEVFQGQPRQVIEDVSAMEIMFADLSEMGEGEREAEIEKAMRAEATAPFDLGRGPLVRIKLLRRDALDHVLLVTMHHINSDGWSEGIMIQEFSRLYEAFVMVKPSPLPELTIQYADYAVWQREWLQGEVLEKQIAYWKNQLADPPVLEMPTDYPRTADENEAGSSLKWELSEELSRKLKELSRREGATLFMTLLAAFQLLLARHSNQTDIAVGSPIAGRTRTEIEPLIGFFVNTIVLRTDLSGRPTFRELLRRVREVTLSAYAHQDVPFEKLVEELQPDRDLGRNPIFQAMFMLQNAPKAQLQLPGLKLSVLERVAENVHFELLMSASERDNGRIEGGLSFRTNLFSDESMRRLLGHWQNLLASAVSNPEKRICELDMLAETECWRIVEEWNQINVGFPDARVHTMVEEHAARTPDAVAVEIGNRQLSYGELNRRANQLAGYLRKIGAQPEVLVGISVERSLEMAIGVVAILKTGAAYVPLDPKYPPARLSYMLENSRINLLVTQKQFLSIFSGQVKSAICLDAGVGAVSQESEDNPNITVDRDNVAFVIYTSGSTGRPKGIAMPHGAATNLVQWHLQQDSGMQPPVTLQFASLSFDVSFQDIFVTWCAGGRLVLVDEDARRDPNELWRILCDRGITRISVPFVALHQLVEAALKTKQRAGGLRELISAGEQLRTTPALQELLTELPHCVLENQYGPSETHVATAHRLGRNPERWPLLPPIGKPRANTQVYLLNEECLPVPVGVAGEIYLGGLQLSRGYVNRPELTAGHFVPNPFSKNPGERLYKTGDLARYMEDGNIEYLGRIDHQVKVRGYRIELGEVESALGECEGVKEAVAAIHEDRPGEKRLVGYVVGRDGQELSEAMLRAELKKRLPEFMVPAGLAVLEKLPLTPSGKVDRKRLPNPGRKGVAKEEEYVLPRNITEEILCGIWEDVLKRERIGVADNFFELGGHSLLATQVVARISDALLVDLPVRRLFEAPTVAGLAQIIEQLRTAGDAEKIPPIVRVARDQAIPLSFAQQRLWFLDQLQPGSAAYNLPLALRLIGPVRLDLVEQALAQLISRHEILRTTFSVQEGQPVQLVAAEGAVSVFLKDLSELPSEAREAEAGRLAQEEADQPFNLSQGPLLRVKMLRLAEQDHVLLVTMHHIVTDGWSMEIMVREFSKLYRAYCEGEESCSLPELPVQYADFSVWQREWLQGTILQKQLQYWKQRLAGLQTLELPADRQRPSVMSYAGAVKGFVIESEQTEHLKAISRRQGATLYMTLLAAFQTLLYRYSGQHDVAVGSPIAGRRRPETEGLIGFFVNTLVMRTDVSEKLTFAELLQRVREVSLEAYSHQDVPFEKVVEELQPERDLGRTPFFQVMFILQNMPQAELQLGDITLRPFDVDSQTAKFDLTLGLSEAGRQLQGWLGYNAELFEPVTMHRMIGHYCTLLQGIVEQPDLTLGELPMLTHGERQQVLVEWNATGTDYGHKFVPELIEEQVERSPLSAAVDDEGRRLTYVELNGRANQLARYLMKLGVGADVRVGICMERSLEMVVALLGILKAGGAYVPLDPDHPAERLKFMVEEAQIGVVLIQEKLAAGFPEQPSKLVKVDAEWGLIDREGDENLDVHLEPENLVYVIYTSGSTGLPKGAMNVHRGLRNRLLWMQENYRLGPCDRVLQKTPYSFDVSVWEFFWPLMVGAELVLARPGGHRDPQYLGDLIQRKGISTLHFVPSMLAAFLESGEESKCESVRRVICSGEALGVDLARRCTGGLGAELHNLYGPTEASIDVTYWKCEPQEIAGAVPIGKPIANTGIYILDTLGRPVPALVAGELYIAGEGLARGYVNRPDLTAERFVPDHVSGRAGERLYRTGDKARWNAAGNLEYLGREDDQVKIRGHRIELGEIESVLMQEHAVGQAAVVVREDECGDKLIVAYLVTREEITVDELRSSLKQRLPDFMLPAAFVRLESMPLTSNGKVDRRALSKVVPKKQSDEKACVLPRNPREELLAQIWAELLRVQLVGIHDNFFELGGHSLLLFRLKTLIKKRLDCDLPLSSLFQNPTIAGMAKLVETTAREPSPVLLPMQVEGKRSPLFCVHPVGGQVLCYVDLARQLGKGQPFYAVQSPDPDQLPAATIEGMADLYIREVRRVQPRGPYLLAGWSMGGLIAFEMAHQLIDEGESVGLLALFDCIPPSQRTGEHDGMDKLSVLEHFALDISRVLPNHRIESREQFLQLQPSEQLDLILDVLLREQLLSPGSGKDELNRLLEIFGRNFRAMEDYLMHPITQRIILFPAADREAPERLAEKWDNWSTEGVEVHPVPGDHYTLLRPPNVSKLAAFLTHYLDPERLSALRNETLSPQ